MNYNIVKKRDEISFVKVMVLMSTYNGESFLREQLDSIFSQKGVVVSVLVRDDGSKDHTIDILKEYKEVEELDWYRGENIGCAKSFWHLLCNCGDADYYAFCDQDDVWDEDKLLIAVAMLQQAEEQTLSPLLYFSDVRTVDKNLNLLHEHMLEKMTADYAHSLIKNIAPGCTYVFNTQAQNVLKEYNPDEYGIDIHDWNVYRIISCFGRVIFDETSHMSYRQHEGNQIGAKRKGIGEGIDAFHRLRDKKFINCRELYAKRMLSCFGDRMSDDNLQITERIALYRTGWKERIELLFDRRFEYKGIKGVYFKLMVLMGKV